MYYYLVPVVESYFRKYLSLQKLYYGSCTSYSTILNSTGVQRCINTLERVLHRYSTPAIYSEYSYYSTTVVVRTPSTEQQQESSRGCPSS